MTTFSRLLLSLLLVGGVSVCVFGLRPDWAEAVGLDLWNLPALEENLTAESAASEELDAQLGELHQRLENKEELARQASAGRLGLLQAAAGFRDLTPASEPARRHLRAAYPGADDDERFCRAVISWLGGRGEAARRAAVRMQAELDATLRRGGRITLPR
jgi:hypothetical protein